ncbi:hypothetical protein [Shewanella sp. GD03713]|uniref:glycosyltransferase family protein n=1 Tax=Shewanella sp. GD03713 TaxID=2975372 RepID=UPI002447EFF6|nr:hypothetical protein [Shewanella sp. GD03713]MDH1469690.1 hypothetical protein [Shewanella sp. GD03713]
MNKKILLFCPSFFGYDIAIKKEMELLGPKVSLFDERPFKSFFGKALLRLNLAWLFRWYIDNYFRKIIFSSLQDLDLIVLVNPESIPPDLLREVKLLNKNVKIVVYMWDSFENKKQASKLIAVSDSFFTFDPIDANDYGVNFLPLFYIPQYEEIRSNKDNDFELVFIGTAHSERYKLVMDITSGFNKVFNFFYTPNKLVFLYKRYFCKELTGLSYFDVSSTPMSRQDVIDTIRKSKAVIDINHPSQVGLTIRTFEIIAAGKKLITTNRNVMDYDFYNENNILYYHNAMNFNDVINFLDKPFIELDETYKSYSLSQWVKRIVYE